MEKGRGLEPSLVESANHSRASRVAKGAEKEETNKPKKTLHVMISFNGKGGK